MGLAKQVEINRKHNLTEKGKEAKHRATKARSAKSRATPNGQHLYMFNCRFLPGSYKVGRAGDPKYRADTMSAAYPGHVRVARIYENFGYVEKLVHDALAPFMFVTEEKSVNEWFSLPYEELVEKINSIISQFEH